MATDVDQSCYEWSHEELIDQCDSGKIQVSQMLDHGSISFGRFALEPLSWEKRSVFTHNRYQEELEKLKAPGLVAKKKAYFEEYYKRIRAIKALQENQHTEPVKYCGYSSDILAMTAEENQRAVPSECYENVIVKTIGPGIQVASAEVIWDKDGKAESMEPDSSARFSNDNKNGESFPDSRQCQILDMNSNNHESIVRSIEDSEQHEFIGLDNNQQPCEFRLESISGQSGEENQRIAEMGSYGDEFETSTGSGSEKALTEAPLGICVETTLLETDPPPKLPEDEKIVENSRNKQFQSWDQNSFYHEPTVASIEESKQFDFISQKKENIVKKSEKRVTKDSVYPESSPRVLELKLNKGQKNLNQAVKGHKGYTFTSGVMEHSSSAGNSMKSEHKTKSRPVMLTHMLRDSSQMRNSQINVCIISPNQTVDRISRSKYSSVTSHGSRKEVHSKVTTPCPTFATGKKSVCSTIVSPRSDAKNISPSSPFYPNNTISKDVSSRLGVSHCLKREKLESSRGHEERGKKPFPTERQAFHLSGGNASSMIGPLKARSVNLPASRGGTVVGINSDKLTRNNEDIKLKLAELVDSSRVRDLKLNTKNSLCCDKILNKRKLQQEKPRWR